MVPTPYYGVFNLDCGFRPACRVIPVPAMGGGDCTIEDVERVFVGEGVVCIFLVQIPTILSIPQTE